MKTALLAIVGLLLNPVLVHATTISVGFEKITNNNVENLGVGGTNQLLLSIYDQTQAVSAFPGLAGSINSTDVLFAFTNNIGTASDITEIYIDDGGLSAISLVQDLAGSTTFSTSNPLNPGNLPGGNTVSPPFVATTALSIDSDQQMGPSNGIDTATDILGIVYTTTGGFAGVQNSIQTVSLRVGLHIRSIGTAGGSDSYLNTPVPEPSTLLLFGAGLAGVGIGARRRRRKENFFPLWRNNSPFWSKSFPAPADPTSHN